MNQQQSTLKSRLTVLIFATQALSCANLDQLEPVDGGQAQPVVQTSGNAVSSTPDCIMQAVRYPTDHQDFQDLLYGNRGFLTVYDNSKHLGYDIIYTEGTAMHPIGCGTVKFYGPATGYGTLVAVVEHKLASSLSAINGDEQDTVFSTFLSIYGHLRQTTQRFGGDELSWQVGDTIQPTDTIGYTQNDALNGDGPEHLHLGIRLQSAAEAKASDSAWFRGNDTPGDGQYKKYYTDPKTFIPNLDFFLNGNEYGDGEPSGTTLATHHPIGTLLHDVSNAEYWLVVGEDTILNVSGYNHLPWGCAVGVSGQTLGCYRQTQFDPFSLYLDAKAIKFQGEPQVYQLYPGNGFAPTAYRTFLSYDSFLSWGYHDNDIVEYAVDQKATQLNGLEDKGFVGMMPGALVKGQGQSEVAVADQDKRRRPIFNWDVFQDLGYKQDCIHEIDPTTLDAVAGPLSDQIIYVAEAMSCGSQPGYICVPGSIMPCGCTNGSAGNQTCRSDGQGYDACQCPVPKADAGSPESDAGTGGTGGTSGQNGTGGTTGSGNQGGDGGTSQTAPPDGGSGGASPAKLCTSGQNYACACGGGLSGYQTCATDGMSYGPCIGCSSGGSGGSNGMTQDAGSGGTSGSPGTGGNGAAGSGGTGGSSNTGGSGMTPDAGSGSGPCATQGVLGKTTFIIDAPVTPSHVISVYGWVHYPNWSGMPDVPWSGWVWGLPNMTQMSFQEGDAYQGAKYIFAPGLSSGPGQAQTAWYCGQDSCPVGTFIVCHGLQEACRFQDGVLSGGASYTPNSADWQNMQCVLP